MLLDCVGLGLDTKASIICIHCAYFPFTLQMHTYSLSVYFSNFICFYCPLCDLYSSALQMLLHILEHTLAKEMVQLFWMMWSVLGMKPGWWTADTLPFITVPIVKMLELVARLNVSLNGLLEIFRYICI